MKSTNHVATLLLSFILVSCGGSDKPKPTETITPVNIAPTVEIESKAIAFENMEVQLVANAQDSDGTIASYTWKQTKGTAIVFSSNTTPNTIFTVPTIEVDEEVTFEVTVTDNDGATNKSTTSLTLVPRKSPKIDIIADLEISEDEELLITLDVEETRGIATYQVIFYDERVEVEQQTDNTFIAKFPNIDTHTYLYYQTTVTTVNGIQSSVEQYTQVIDNDYNIHIIGSNGVRPQDIYNFEIITTGKLINTIEVTQTSGPQIDIIVDLEKIQENSYHILIPPEITTRQDIQLLFTVTFEDNHIQTYEKKVTIMENKSFEYHDIDTETAQSAIKKANSHNPELNINWREIKIPNDDIHCGKYKEGFFKPYYYQLVDINQDGLKDIYFYFQGDDLELSFNLYCEGFILAEKQNVYTGLSYITYAYRNGNYSEPEINFIDITGDGYLDRITSRVNEVYDAYTALIYTQLINNIDGQETAFIKPYRHSPFYLENIVIDPHFRRGGISGNFINSDEFNIVQLSTNLYTIFFKNKSHLNATKNWITIGHLTDGKMSKEDAFYLGDDIVYSLHKGDINNDGILEIILKYEDGSYRYITF